jgi:CRISPR-associated protein Csx10
MNASGAPSYRHFKLRLRSPAIVSTLSGDPNHAATQPFIPGSAIRGAVAARLLSAGVDGDSDEFRNLVLSGAVRYLHAYPEIAGDRALPTPLSWKGEKDDPSSALDLAAFSGVITDEDDAEEFGDKWPDTTLVSVADPFAASSVSGGARSTEAPRISARVHQQRDRVKGRPWKDRAERSHGAIFAYEFLDAEQVFCGAIQVMRADAAFVERLEKLLAQPILVGRSRRAGYGGEAALTEFRDTAREYENVTDRVRGGVPAGMCFRALLTSAYVGRHPATGQIDPTALEHELRAELGADVTVERRRWDFDVVGGFSQKWRLELPQVLAVRAGSVLVLRANQAIPPEVLLRVEHEGIGERRTEGFGRVLFLEHSEDPATIRLHREARAARQIGEQTDSTPPLRDFEKEQLALVERRIILAAARAELDRIAALDVAAQAHGIPTNSLLGRIRTVFRGVSDEATAQGALRTLATWCSDGGENPNVLRPGARKKLEKCRVPNGNLLQWLRGLAGPERDQKQRWEALLEASGNQTTLTGLAAKHHLTEAQAAQAILHVHAAELSVYLVDAVLAALARINRGKSRGGAS